MKKIRAELIFSLLPTSFFLLCIWGIKGLEILLQTSFYQLGVYPRRISGLIGIITAPLIHSNLEHISSNTIPVLVLGTALFFFYRKIAYEVVFISYAVTGVWVWIFAVPGHHAGASGLIYALSFFLFFSGIFRKKREAMAVALLVILLYGSIIWGMLPFDPKISWQTHLYGGIIGTLLAFFYAKESTMILNRKKESSFTNIDSTLDLTDNDGEEIMIQYHYKEKSEED